MAVSGNELIHDAAAGADEFIFGALADDGELGAIEVVVWIALGQQSEGCRNFDGGGRAEA